MLALRTDDIPGLMVDYHKTEQTLFFINCEAGRLTGYHSNHDFPYQPPLKTRGEIFSVQIERPYQSKGVGTYLALLALRIMKGQGSTSVNIAPTTRHGGVLVKSLIRRGYISAPIQVSKFAKTEYMILIDDAPIVVQVFGRILRV
jgi:hypothetical protein